MNALVYLIYVAVMIYVWFIVARAIMSWFHPQPGGPAYRLNRILVSATEPYLGIFRRWIPVIRVGSMAVDLSSLVGLVVLLVFIQLLVVL